MNKQTFDQIFESLRQSLPTGLSGDVEKNIRAALSSSLTRLDLVAREEFEVQSQVLARTRARLEALERQVAELESRHRTM